MSSENPTVAVIGGGAAGLTAALFLARAGLAVHVYDQDRSILKRARLCNLPGHDELEGRELLDQLRGGLDARAVTRYFYAHAEPNRVIAALAPAILGLAAEGDATAHQVLVESATELLDLAHRVAAQLFPGTALDTIPTGLSGALLIHPTVLAALAPRTPLPLSPITEAPIEGVRRLLARAA